MEELTMKDMLEAQIKSCIEELKNAVPGSKEHAFLSSDVQKLLKAYTTLLDCENSKIDADRKFKEEIRRGDLDRDYRDALERDKMSAQLDLEREKMKFDVEIRTKDRESREESERTRLKAEEMLEKAKIEESRKSNLRDLAIKCLLVGGTTIGYLVLTALGMRLEFIDNGSITSWTTKELLKALHPKLPTA